MTVGVAGQDQTAPRPGRSWPPLDPTRTGMKGLCPRCGEGRLFDGLLKFRDRCRACGMEFDEEIAGDGPTVFIIMALGFVVLGLALWVELSFAPPFWLHALLWVPLIFALGLPSMRALKGYLFAQAYVTGARSGTLDR